MMHQDGDFKYQETSDFQAVQLPYEGGLQMQVFLPATNSNPQKLLEGFKAGGNWQGNVESGFAQRKGLLIFPKFKMSYDVNLNDPLKALGIKHAFDADKADFSAMADEPLFISEVKQKSYVNVDEKGTEAAAVTTVNLMKLSRPRLDFRMIVDRPFLFVISDDATDSILFIGIVNDPAIASAN
jgi:serpin B